MKWILETRHVIFKELIRSMDNNGFTTFGILDEIQKTMIIELKCEFEHFKRSIMFMSMYNEIDWRKTRKKI